MNREGSRIFLGFGFGPIQSGLFLYEAQQSGNFDRYVVAEVNDALVRSIRSAGGICRINIAGKETIEASDLAELELFNPTHDDDRRALVAAVAEADEIATSLPSVRFYDTGGETSVAGILAEGLSLRDANRPLIVYAAENHNTAAEQLAEAVASHMPSGPPEHVQFLNTVIGKMSGMIEDSDTIDRLRLKTITPDLPRAVLVEEFNRILISRIALPGVRRGIEVFREKDNPLPFEEAKLYGHNAIHAMIAYLADMRVYTTIAEAGTDEALMAAARRAFLEESGPALCRRWSDIRDPLFTPGGFRAYAEDLLRRMVNPCLHDRVERVGRDPVRKLGYDDRFFGTMRMILDQGIEPRNLALGAAAGVISMILRRDELPEVPELLPASPNELTPVLLARILEGFWGDGHDADVVLQLIDLTNDALDRIKQDDW